MNKKLLSITFLSLILLAGFANAELTSIEVANLYTEYISGANTPEGWSQSFNSAASLSKEKRDFVIAQLMEQESATSENIAKALELSPSGYNSFDIEQRRIAINAMIQEQKSIDKIWDSLEGSIDNQERTFSEINKDKEELLGNIEELIKDPSTSSKAKNSFSQFLSNKNGKSTIINENLKISELKFLSKEENHPERIGIISNNKLVAIPLSSLPEDTDKINIGENGASWSFKDTSRALVNDGLYFNTNDKGEKIIPGYGSNIRYNSKSGSVVQVGLGEDNVAKGQIWSKGNTDANLEVINSKSGKIEYTISTDTETARKSGEWNYAKFEPVSTESRGVKYTGIKLEGKIQGKFTKLVSLNSPEVDEQTRFEIIGKPTKDGENPIFYLQNPIDLGEAGKNPDALFVYQKDNELIVEGSSDFQSNNNENFKVNLYTKNNDLDIKVVRDGKSTIIKENNDQVLRVGENGKTYTAWKSQVSAKVSPEGDPVVSYNSQTTIDSNAQPKTRTDSLSILDKTVFDLKEVDLSKIPNQKEAQGYIQNGFKLYTGRDYKDRLAAKSPGNKLINRYYSINEEGTVFRWETVASYDFVGGKKVFNGYKYAWVQQQL